MGKGRGFAGFEFNPKNLTQHANAVGGLLVNFGALELSTHAWLYGHFW